MSFFGVTREKIGEVRNHPNADRLDLAKIAGLNFQFVIGRDSYKVGDEVLYFPIDAILPLNTSKALGLDGKLAGKNKDRVKTIRLRGEISQGVVGNLSMLPDAKETNTELITEALGVTKYEPPVVPCKAGNLIQLPVGLSAYDLEGAERNMDILERLMDVPVIITEKLEGQNFSITWSAKNKRIYVNQRNYSIEPIEGKSHDFWRVSEEKNFIKHVKLLVKERGIEESDVTFYGEFLGPGVQGNIYKLQEHNVKFFDLKINEDYIDAIEFNELVNINDRVPTVFSGGTLRKFLDGQDIVEASHGISTLNSSTFREGIVIKPEYEDRVDGFGRLVIKQRDPIYLSKEK
jgi:RNA ligase (TIGR02306 family)